jgi:hypothetical protein
MAAGGVAAALSGCMSPPEQESAVVAPVRPSARPGNLTVDSGYAPPPGFQVFPYHPPSPEPVVVKATSAIIPRSAWTKAGPAKPYMPMDGVALLTFHHDGDPVPFSQNDYALTAQYLERIRAYHARTGFQDIGYHYAIDRAGRVWELRPVIYRGEHVRADYDSHHVYHKWNDHNVGVVVLGNFMLQSPTAAQKQRICLFGAYLRRKYNLTIAQVKVHQELVTTECPGVNLRPYMDEVRRDRLI